MDPSAFRHELKYRISESDASALRSRLRVLMPYDEHADSDGSYTIRSVYFDSFDDRALREKIDGLPYREKFRIRWYNDSFSPVFLEKKVKNRSLCGKLSAPLTLSECRDLESGDLSRLSTHGSPLVRELAGKMRAEALRPRVLVSYRREAFVYAPGNVRITFDSHIRSSLFAQHFFSTSGSVPDVEAAPGVCILEVKYDAFLPDSVRMLLETGTLRQGAFSKYAACRAFG